MAGRGDWSAGSLQLSASSVGAAGGLLATPGMYFSFDSQEDFHHADADRMSEALQFVHADIALATLDAAEVARGDVGNRGSFPLAHASPYAMPTDLAAQRGEESFAVRSDCFLFHSQ